MSDAMNRSLLDAAFNNNIDRVLYVVMWIV